MCMSTHSKYYASNIRNLTRKLIYVPWFETSDFESDNYPQNYNMQYYCTVPGVILSDEVYVTSTKIRDRYIDKLVEFCGEETHSIWQDKVKITPYKKEELQGDKLLIYFSPSTILEYKEDMVEKITKCIDIISSNSNNSNHPICIWHIDKQELDMIKENDANAFEGVINLISNISGNITIDYDMSDEQLIKVCKAYYGDGSYLSKAFTIAKKPVMIENPKLFC